jgi:hypothetical protein
LGFLIVLGLLLSACSSKTLTFFGESDKWSAELKVSQSSGFEKQNFVLKYKGDEVNSVGEITYRVESAGGFGQSGVKLEENGSLRHIDEADPTNAKVTENTKVKVSVEWNGNTETIELKIQ